MGIVRLGITPLGKFGAFCTHAGMSPITFSCRQYKQVFVQLVRVSPFQLIEANLYIEEVRVYNVLVGNKFLACGLPDYFIQDYMNYSIIARLREAREGCLDLPDGGTCIFSF